MMGHGHSGAQADGLLQRVDWLGGWWAAGAQVKGSLWRWGCRASNRSMRLMSGAWCAMTAAKLSVHWMRQGSEWLSMREAVLTVCPIIVKKFCAPTQNFKY